MTEIVVASSPFRVPRQIPRCNREKPCIDFRLKSSESSHGNSPVDRYSGHEARVELVLIQTFLCYYVNHVFLMLINFLGIISIRIARRFVSKQGQPRPHAHSKASILSPQL